ncbi:zincin-like metallopeptidase domain-containing protein [uncultured Duncaniella sp.]|uniref:ArdC family protein n=1 Tax=uncultured Duncaniella sp. TaxID=2768039 RepID=UPI0025A9B84E|nr:zincin-like metallopeptidase domain-containing protein [uncultured Duncaniella sp.]
MKSEIYEQVTARIIEMLDKGEITWQKPWVASFDCRSGATKRPYSLLNQLLLGMRPGYYFTFKQVKERGGHIRKGAKSEAIFFYKTLSFNSDDVIGSTDENGHEADSILKKRIPMLKMYRVFHQSDIEGINCPEIDTSGYTHTLDSTAEAVIADYIGRESIRFNNAGSNRAFYRPFDDSVTVPNPSQFADIAEYYSTTFHELSHSTLTESRCNRKPSQGIAFFGSVDYSREELVAEISSAMLCHRTNVDTQKAFRNSVAYIQGWRRALKNDPAAIVWAASRAEKAARYILNEEQSE